VRRCSGLLVQPPGRDLWSPVPSDTVLTCRRRNQGNAHEPAMTSDRRRTGQLPQVESIVPGKKLIEQHTVLLFHPGPSWPGRTSCENLLQLGQNDVVKQLLAYHNPWYRLLPDGYNIKTPAL